VDKRRLLIGGLVCATGIGAVYWLAAEVHPFGLNSRMIEWRVNRILGAPLRVHHSQKELNFFTDFRYHVVEYVVRHTFLVIPFLVLAVEAPTIILFAIFQRWYTRVYHGNIRTNLGPLRYLLVTPQSHRVHHSIEGRHRDRNFGSLFSIWDRLFGTQYRRYDEYPDTGIEDAAFPSKEAAGSGISC
jgi:sterol desaturase/sphingolipid hydroxylase (fatty acid hydroxylase superfamily)